MYLNHVKIRIAHTRFINDELLVAFLLTLDYVSEV